MEFVAGGDMFEFVVSKKGLKESEARYDVISLPGAMGNHITMQVK